MGKMTKRKERKGNSLHLSAQTLSQTIPAISCTKSPPWVSLSWMAASWIRGKSLCLYPHSMIEDLSWCWSVCSDSSDYLVLRCKAPHVPLPMTFPQLIMPLLLPPLLQWEAERGFGYFSSELCFGSQVSQTGTHSSSQAGLRIWLRSVEVFLWSHRTDRSFNRPFF